MKKNNALQRIIAGSLAALLTFTALPEGTITALAATHKVMITADAVETGIVEIGTGNPDNINFGDNYSLKDGSTDAMEDNQTESDRLNFMNYDSDLVNLQYSDDVDTQDSEEAPSESESVDSQGGVPYTVTVTRVMDSNITSFKYSIWDENDAYVKGEVMPFDGKSSVTIPVENEGCKIQIITVNVTDQTYFAYVDGTFSEEMPKKSISSDETITLTTGRIKIAIDTVDTPKHRNVKVAELETIEETSDGTTIKKSAFDGTDYYAVSSSNTKIKIKKVANSDIDIQWDDEKSPSVSYGATNLMVPECISTLSNDEYTIELSVNALARAISTGASTVSIKPHVKANHHVSVSLGTDDVSSGISGASLSCMSYYADGTPFYLSEKSESSINKTSSINVNVPDGGYIEIYDVDSNDDTIYFQSATMTYSGSSSSVGTSDPSEDLTRNKPICTVNMGDGLAYHGSIALNFAKYNYKVWQGDPEAAGYGEKGLIHVPDTSFNVSFDSGLKSNGYYDVPDKDNQGNDDNWSDVVLSFNSTELINEVSCLYDGMTEAQKESYTYKPVSAGETGNLVAPPGGHGDYTLKVPKDLIKSAKTAGKVIDITITPVNAYVLTMRMVEVAYDDSETVKNASSSSRASVKVEYNEVSYTDTVTETNKITHTGSEANSLRLWDGTEATITVTIDKDKQHKYAATGVRINGEANETLSEELCKNGKFTYIITANTRIDIVTDVLPYLSYTVDNVTKEVVADGNYAITKVTDDTDETKYASVNYADLMTMQYLVDGEAQVLDRDYSISIGGTTLGDEPDTTHNLPAMSSIVKLSTDTEGKAGKKLILDFSSVPGKDVVLQIGGIKTDEYESISSTLEPRYYTIHVIAKNYKLYINELYAKDDGDGNETSRITDITVMGGKLDASGKYYLIPVDDAATNLTPSITVKIDVPEDDQMKYQLDSVTTSGSSPPVYSIDAKKASVTISPYVISEDTTINVGLSGRKYLSYLYPATSADAVLIHGEDEEPPIDGVYYSDKAVIQYVLGDTPQALTANDYTLNLTVYEDGNPQTYKLVGTDRDANNPRIPAKTEVAGISGSSLVIDFSTCASILNDGRVYKLQIVFGGSTNEYSNLEKKDITFKINPVPYHNVTVKLDSGARAAVSVTENEVELIPVSSSDEGSVYSVIDQAVLTISSTVKSEDKYELSKITVKEGTSAANSRTPDGKADSFNLTATADTLVTVNTSDKTYLEYTNTYTAATSFSIVDNTYMSSDTSYNTVADIRYMIGDEAQDLEGKYSAMLGTKRLTSGSDPMLSDVISYDSATKKLNIKLLKAGGSILTVKIGSGTMTQKTLIFNVESLPDRVVELVVNSSGAAETSTIADVSVSGISVTPEDGKFIVPHATELTITVVPKPGFEYMYGFHTAEITPTGEIVSTKNIVKGSFTYTVESDVKINIIPTGLPNLSGRIGGTSSFSYAGAPEDETRMNVNYDQTGSLQYMLGESAQRLLTDDIKVFVGANGTDPDTLMSDPDTTHPLYKINSDNETIALDFYNYPSQSVKFVIGGEGTSLAVQRQIIFDIAELETRRVTVKIDGEIPGGASHARVSLYRGSDVEPLTVGTDGSYQVSDRDDVRVVAELDEENKIKYYFEKAVINFGDTEEAQTVTPGTGTEDAWTEAFVITKNVTADGTIDIFTGGFPYLAYTVGGISGFTGADPDDDTSRLNVGASEAISVQYMIGDVAQRLSAGLYSVSLDGRTLTGIADDLYPALEEVATVSSDGLSLLLDFNDKKCKDHVLSVTFGGEGSSLKARKINFYVTMIYTINTGGVDDVIKVSDELYRNNVILWSGVESGYVGMHSGRYDNELKGNLVFTLCDSTSCSIDDISGVSIRVEGSTSQPLKQNEDETFTVTRAVLEEFITRNKEIVIELSVVPATYETNLKLAKGLDYAGMYYNADDKTSGYEVAYPVWSKTTTARKLEKVELLNSAGAVIATSTSLSTGGPWAGAIRYTTDIYQNTSIWYNPGQTQTYASASGGRTVVYSMPAGKYTIVAYAREPYGHEVTARMTITLGQAITGLEVKPSSRYLYKTRGKAATFKVNAIYHGGDQKAGGTYVNEVAPSTQIVSWYPGDASGNPMTYSDPYYGGLTYKNGSFTLNRNYDEYGDFYVWAVAADYTGNTVKAGVRITVRSESLGFTSIQTAVSGQIVAPNGTYEATSLFGDETAYKNKEYAYDRLMLMNGTEDVTDCFTVKVSGGAKNIDDNGGIVFVKPGTVTVTATANDGSKTKIVHKFEVTYGRGDLAYVLTVGDNSEQVLTRMTTGSRNVVAEANPMPEGKTLTLTVYGLTSSGDEVLIGNKVKLKGGKILSRSDKIHGTVYSVKPTAAMTDIYVTDTLAKREYNLIVHNNGIEKSRSISISAKNISPINHVNRGGRIYSYLNYKETEEATYFNNVFFDKYSEIKCNDVIYTVKGMDVGINNAVMLETASPYMGEILEANGFQEVDVSADKTGVYLAPLDSDHFEIDYTMDDKGYLNIPKGKYVIYATVGHASTSGAVFDVDSFDAFARTKKISISASEASKGRVKVRSSVKFDKSGQYGVLVFDYSSAVIKGTATFNMDLINSTGGYPLKGVNRRGVINTFAYDYAVDDRYIGNNYKPILKFTGIGSDWLLDSNGSITAKKAKKWNLMTGYVPYAYQNIDGTISFEYGRVNVSSPGGLKVCQ